MDNQTEPKTENRTFTATIKGMSIISVMATSFPEAKTKIEEQLQRPGRYAYYLRWMEDGCNIIERPKAWDK